MAKKTQILITGATGMIGRRLTEALLSKGYPVEVTSRNPAKARKILGEKPRITKWDGQSTQHIQQAVNHAAIIINLLGENIAGKKWTARQKAKILHSRQAAGLAISEAISLAPRKPHTLLQASATGYYPQSTSDSFTEHSNPGTGFLAEVSEKWEQATDTVEALGVRRVLLRTGVVLHPSQGALPKLLMPFKFFFGMIPGSGQQWVSWIHYQDEIKAIIHLMEDREAKGPYNLTAPRPLNMSDFMKVAGAALHRPVLGRIPGWAVKLVMGEMADATALRGNRVIPQKLDDEGFLFDFPSLEIALDDLLKGPKRTTGAVT